jgi:hypothetical protein
VPKIFRNTLGTASPAFTDSSAFPCTPGGNPSAPPR